MDECFVKDRYVMIFGKFIFFKYVIVWDKFFLLGVCGVWNWIFMYFSLYVSGLVFGGLGLFVLVSDVIV